MYSCSSLDIQIPQDPPLRTVCKLAGMVIWAVSPVCCSLSADSKRPSIAPKYMLRSLLLS